MRGVRLQFMMIGSGSSSMFSLHSAFVTYTPQGGACNLGLGLSFLLFLLFLLPSFLQLAPAYFYCRPGSSPSCSSLFACLSILYCVRGGWSNKYRLTSGFTYVLTGLSSLLAGIITCFVRFGRSLFRASAPYLPLASAALSLLDFRLLPFLLPMLLVVLLLLFCVARLNLPKSLCRRRGSRR